VKASSLLPALLLTLNGAALAACPAPFGGEGRAFYYDTGGQIGACLLPWQHGERVAAINAVQWDQAAHCGEYLRVTGPLGSTVVRVVDRCPECGLNELDLSLSAFDEIGNRNDGQAPIRWERIAHPNPGALAFHVKEGSSQFWLALQVREHRYGITALSILVGGSYQPVQREDYNYFVRSTGAGPGPLQVRVTASTGEVLEQTLPLYEGNVVQGQGQFAVCSDAFFADGFETRTAGAESATAESAAESRSAGRVQ
jgi:expansin (peptidoglycan-binding protein)